MSHHHNLPPITTIVVTVTCASPPLTEGHSVCLAPGKHPVSALVELCSKRKWSPPEFEMVFDCGPEHKKNFLMKVRAKGGEGLGRNSLLKERARGQGGREGGAEGLNARRSSS